MILEAKNAPNLADLMVRFVSRPIDAATLDAQTAAYGEVEPHEVAVGFRADPRLAWNEGLAVYATLGISETLKASASVRLVGSGRSPGADCRSAVCLGRISATRP